MPASQSNAIVHLKACFVHASLHWDWEHRFKLAQRLSIAWPRSLGASLAPTFNSC